jgi:hypothetical protein
MNYRKALKDMVIVQREVEKLRAEKETLGKGVVSVKTTLSSISDPSLLLSEDRGETVVQAAPLEMLAKLLFHPANADKHYVSGLLVLLHSEPIDLGEFVQYTEAAFQNTEWPDIRVPRMKGLIEKWKHWFPNDLHDPKKKAVLLPMFNLVGTAGMFDIQPSSMDDCQFDASVPVLTKEKDLALWATPHILAEHFAYYDLQILRGIPAYEFMGDEDYEDDGTLQRDEFDDRFCNREHRYLRRPLRLLERCTENR